MRERKVSKEEKIYLEKYDDSMYPHPSVATDIAVFSVSNKRVDNYRKLPERKLQILLVKRGQYPYKDCYALPGGFAKPTETLDECARRELLEETHVDYSFLQQLRTFSEPDRDPRGWIISASYLALVDSDKYSVSGGDDAKEALWFDVEFDEKDDGIVELNLSYEDIRISTVLQNITSKYDVIEKYSIIEYDDILAFDHSEIIVCALIQLRKWISDTGIAFRLLPEHFTLTQLQQVHEAVKGVRLLSPAFRRKIGEYVEETGVKTADEGHRPAMLYREVKE